MALATGTKLGPYEVVAQIGAGEMGEVYQAHDTRLGRDVAIKVLPEVFAHDPERLSRFQREAKMLASLNHANIATIHGLEQSGNNSFLVMELVSGETLAERVKAGPLAIQEALKIAVQVAEALEAAHEKSIIHRDLKPANVKVTPEGKVKVLDFGLAKAFEGNSTNEDMSNSPTLSRAATMQGVILGTAAYMSPEQAKGKAVDKRTDIWAFGCVLYELLTGKPAFQGEDITDILAAVVRAEPDWEALPDATPVKIRDLLRRCLQKDKAHRMQAAGDARIEVHEALTAPASVATVDVAANWVVGWRLPVLIGLVALVVGSVAGVVGWNLKPAPRGGVTRTIITLPPGDRLAAFGQPTVAISPDGNDLAYVAIRGSMQQLFVRAMDGLEAKPLPNTEGADSPFFSSDGRWLGFFAEGKLKKVAVSGGAAVTLRGNVSYSRGATWNGQGAIIFEPSTNTVPLQEISDGGGVSRSVTQFERGQTTHRWPEFLPDGRSVVFAAGGSTGNWANLQIVAQSLDGGKQRNLIQGGAFPRYASSGHLLYAQAETLMAVPFDAQRLQLTGAAVPVLENVMESSNTGAAQYSISTTGSLIYVFGGARAHARKLVWVSRNGAEQPVSAPLRGYSELRTSPDGRRLSTTIDEQDAQTWTYDLTRDTLTRLSFGGNDNLYAVWTPDGARIAYSSNREGPPNIYWQSADGSGGVERLNSSEHGQYPSSFSSDGKLLAFTDVNPSTGLDIWILRLSDQKAEPFIQAAFNQTAARFSPDGNWLAYVSDESGRNEIYVQAYPGPSGKYQVSTEGGTEPVWNRNGRELFYRSGDQMMAVEVTTHPRFSAEKPKVLFAGPYRRSEASAFPEYEVSTDGQRFLMIKENEQNTSLTQIVVVQNWFEELKRLVPTGK